MSMASRCVAAADTIREVNARIDSGPQAAWTAADLDHMAGSFAAEDHDEGVCPVCRKPVMANDIGCIGLHRDTFSRTCVASGQPFAVAVVS